MTYRDLSALPSAEADFSQFLTQLHDELTKGRKDPNELVSETLQQIYFGRSLQTSKIQHLPLASRALLHSLDPRNVTTEPEYYAEIDAEQYAERKPLIWLWQMFDRSPLGQNALLGHRFRRLLAPRIFKSVGENFKCWNHVEWSFGYNLSFGNNVVVHRHVLLDDRGGIEVGNNVSISDYVKFTPTPTSSTKFPGFTIFPLASVMAFVSLTTARCWPDAALATTPWWEPEPW